MLCVLLLLYTFKANSDNIYVLVENTSEGGKYKEHLAVWY